MEREAGQTIVSPPKKRKCFRTCDDSASAKSESIGPSINCVSYLAALLHKKKVDTGNSLDSSGDNALCHRNNKNAVKARESEVESKEIQRQKNRAWETFLCEMFDRNQSAEDRGLSSEQVAESKKIVDRYVNPSDLQCADRQHSVSPCRKRPKTDLQRLSPKRTEPPDEDMSRLIREEPILPDSKLTNLNRQEETLAHNLNTILSPERNGLNAGLQFTKSGVHHHKLPSPHRISPERQGPTFNSLCFTTAPQNLDNTQSAVPVTRHNATSSIAVSSPGRHALIQHLGQTIRNRAAGGHHDGKTAGWPSHGELSSAPQGHSPCTFPNAPPPLIMADLATEQELSLQQRLNSAQNNDPINANVPMANMYTGVPARRLMEQTPVYNATGTSDQGHSQANGLDLSVPSTFWHRSVTGRESGQAGNGMPHLTIGNAIDLQIFNAFLPSQNGTNADSPSSLNEHLENMKNLNNGDNDGGYQNLKKSVVQGQTKPASCGCTIQNKTGVEAHQLSKFLFHNGKTAPSFSSVSNGNQELVSLASMAEHFIEVALKRGVNFQKSK